MIKPYLTSAAVLLGGMLLAAPTQASVIDLQHNDTGTLSNGARFDVTFQQPTGTGVIQPFLRVQNSPTEQGYNTSGGTPFDDKAGPWTHDIQFSDLMSTTVTLGGTSYFRILLDVNEPGGSKSLISLDQLRFYTSPIGSKTTTDISSLGTLRFDMDFGGNNQVVIDASRNHGSGSGDVNIYIPTSYFAGTNAQDFVYMYVLFGDSDETSQGGFEEFALVQNITPVPEMSALFPIVGLLVAVSATHWLRRRKQAQMTA
ncbi:MAG: hypothetical protein M3032_13520 [Verrucomicrobiota bacterium]|nr:hypothetical protein [Verrucomicrobiota bacterium]